MSIYDEQLRFRKKTDNANFEDAIDSIANAVMGIRLVEALGQDSIAGSAIEEILKFYHRREKSDELPAKFNSVEEQIEYRMRPFGIKSRAVTLEKGWYHHAVGAMLGTLKEDGSAVALIPGKLSGYQLIHIKTGKHIKLNAKTEQLLDKEAVCFYEPLPLRALSAADLLKFMAQQLRAADVALVLVLTGLATAMGLLSPMFTKWLFGDVLESGSLQMLMALAVFMVCYCVASLLFGVFRGLVNARIGIKQSVAVEAAIMNRIMSLPPTFFREYSSGELAQRADYAQTICSTLFSTIGMTGITSVFSLVYIGQIFAFAPSLAAPSLGIMLVTVALNVLTMLRMITENRKQMALSAKTAGLSYATITGIQKIKLAGAEKRMFSRWAKQYAKEAHAAYNPPAFFRMITAATTGVSLIGTLILYAAAVKSGVSVAEYYAFNTAYAMVSAAIAPLSSILMSISGIKPAFDMAKPFLQAVPETHDEKENLTAICGSIELSHVSFRYDESMPNVLNDFSLKIREGEYLAIVGPTGCGKSTLMRLLLGFETPQKGSIFYDNKDISRVDPESLRKKIGVVMQDGKLFLGDIYSNIVITAPELGMDAAWAAAEIASVADDIGAMPMGMFTVISEGQGGISGGQKQRIMIARAVAPRPRVLMFDEATSALDNITQKKVSDAIDDLKCTRIVIAHRLSTIQHADRILYLEDGRIAEEGTYDELIARSGKFAGLVERQRLELDV